MIYTKYSDCKDCLNRKTQYKPIPPYFPEKPRTGTKIMFIGQDPTIRKKQDRVKCALMLDDDGSQISKWLNEIFTPSQFKQFDIYATNLVKCVLDKVPTDPLVGGIEYLIPFFENCKKYLLEELSLFSPQYVFTLGEPAHQLFISLIEDRNDLKKIRMQDYFTGSFSTKKYGSLSFEYSPLLHIQGYRVAKKYGKVIVNFEKEIQKRFI